MRFPDLDRLRIDQLGRRFDEPTTSEPETVTVTLAIRDDRPLESFTNAGGGECSSRGLKEA